MAPPRVDPVERIMRKIRKDGSCWIYTGAKTRDGYGVIGVGGKQHRVHRVMFERFVKKLKDGEFVCHTCDIPACCNPDHLFNGTPLENTRDMLAKGRRKILKGETHPNSKISNAQRMQIYNLREQGVILTEIAKSYGIAFQTVSAIHARIKKNGAKH